MSRVFSGLQSHTGLLEACTLPGDQMIDFSLLFPAEVAVETEQFKMPIVNHVRLSGGQTSLDTTFQGPSSHLSVAKGRGQTAFWERLVFYCTYPSLETLNN